MASGQSSTPAVSLGPTAYHVGNSVLITAYERPILFNGKPYIRDGVEVTHAAFTGQTKLTRQIHNCAERSVFMMAVTEYDDPGKVINFSSRDRSQAEFFEVVPGSIGEKLLDFVCKVF